MKKPIQFFNIFLTVLALFGLFSLIFSYYSIGQHAYRTQGLSGTANFVINITIKKDMGIGMAVGIWIAAAVVLARTRTKTKWSSRRVSAMAIFIVLAIAVCGFMIVLNSMMSKDTAQNYARYFDVKNYVKYSIISLFFELRPLPRAYLISLAGIVCCALVFPLAWLDRKLFKTDLAVAVSREPNGYVWKIALFVSSICLAFAAMHRPPMAKPNSPDIILISLDTVRADHLGCYGYHLNITPNLDALAKDGMVAEYAIAHAPWTIPTHATIFTGLLPTEHGMDSPTKIFPAKLNLLGEIIKNQGYRTFGLVTIFLLSPANGYGAGFDEYSAKPFYHAKDVFNAGARFLTRSKKPAFLFLHTYDPHYPYLPPPGFYGMLDKPDPSLDQKLRLPFYTFLRWIESQPLETKKRVIARYDEEIAATDAAFGAFVNYLKKIGRYDNTWIVVVSDHGEELGDHDHWGHGLALYDESIRTVLIVKAPKSSCAGSRFQGAQWPQKSLFSLLIDATNPLDSADLTCNEKGVLKRFAALANTDTVIIEASMVGPRRFAARTIDAKLIEPVKLQGSEVNYVRSWELFDLIKDPGENQNIHTFGAREDLETSIEAARLHDKAMLAPSTKKLDEATKQRLKALGYLH